MLYWYDNMKFHLKPSDFQWMHSMFEWHIAAINALVNQWFVFIRFNCILGDGRNDSPGHSAQYCTYTVMEHGTDRILALQTVDKREVERKSPNMERLGCRRALDSLMGINVTEFVTDAHVQILAMLSKSIYRHSHIIIHAYVYQTQRVTARLIRGPKLLNGHIDFPILAGFIHAWVITLKTCELIRQASW